MSLKNFTRLCEKLQQIKDTPGKNDKFALLQALAADTELAPLAKEYFSITLDWYRIYNIGEKTLAEPKAPKAKAPKGKAKGKKVVADQGDMFEDMETPAPFAFNPTFEAFVEWIKQLETQRLSAETIRNFANNWPDAVKPWVRRALLKDLDIGVSEKTINKVWPKLINYFEVQLADVLDDVNALGLPEKDPKHGDGKIDKLYWLEPKLDGIRAVCRVNPKTKTVKFLSRGGQPLYNTAPAGINAFLLSAVTDEVVLDGELYGENWNETSKVTAKGEGEADPALVAKLRFYVFDMLTAKEWDDQKCDRPYIERRAAIAFTGMNEANAKDEKVVKTVSHAVESVEGLQRLYKQYLKMGMEGVMVKDPNGLYVFKRSSAWLKYKPVQTDEFKVVGIEEGSGKHKGRCGALIIQIKEGLTCNVGSGMDDATREEFWAKPPVGKVVEVKFKERTPDGLLREPIFLRVRDDKKLD